MAAKLIAGLVSVLVFSAPALNAAEKALQPRGTEIAQAPSSMAELIRAAKREGKVEVNLGGQMPRKLRTAMPAFEKKYGIKVNFKTGGSR
ncbi:MAG: hypothetical protein OEO83_19375, partial [Alphaproteobacteria bacterium]|nr:hypothetical protein [Alphaproteobacteria bacterium]